MTIEERLDAELKSALKARDSDRAACIRQVRAKSQEAMNAADFDGKHDDEFFLKIIGGYVKALQKSIKELEPAGDKSRPLRDRYGAEIAYLESYLPKKLDAEATRALVRDTVAALGATTSKDAGKVMGLIMKNHREVVDAQLAKEILAGLLTS